MPFADFVRQVSILMSLPTVLLMGGAAAAIVVIRDWRLVLFAYALLSATLALLLTQAVPTEWALMQAIVGGLVAVMLFLSARQLRGVQTPGSKDRWPLLASLVSFRLLVVALSGVGFVVAHEYINLPGVSSMLRDAVLWLGLMGVLGLALHEEPLHAGLALLMILGAFLLLLYHLVQQRMLVGLMGGWQLLIGLAISYLTLAGGLGAGSSTFELPWRWRR